MILPQALRRLLPPFVSLLVNIIQNTTIAQIIGAAELLEAGERSVERLTFTSITTGAVRVACARDLRRRRGRVLPDLVPADAARRVPRTPPDLATRELSAGFPQVSRLGGVFKSGTAVADYNVVDPKEGKP